MKILILRLSNGRDTAASSTHHVLAEQVRCASADAVIDFAFLPPKRSPAVAGVLTGEPWTAFDLILVTASFVQETINLPWLLAEAGVSPWAGERPASFPPIILGGSNAFASAFLVRPDGTAVPDAFFFGEAEATLPLFLLRMSEARKGVRTTGDEGKRFGLLRAAEGLDGFWVTGSLPAQPVKQAVARDTPFRVQGIPSAFRVPDVETAGTVRLTVSRGCPAFCSFCFEGYERKPYRELPLQEALARARFLKQAYGATTLELDAFNLNMYTGLVPLVRACAKLFDHLSFKSQRADGLAAAPEIVDLERACGKQSFTLGIEGISARMRAFLCKSLEDAAIDAALEALLARRVREIKLFYIVTGHETPEDLAAFSTFCSRLQDRLAMPGCGTRVILSFGRLVRMPNTPLMFDRLMLHEKQWRFSVDGVSAACRRAKLEYRFAFNWPDYVGTQLLAACGHEQAEAVVRLAGGGLTYHEPWQEHQAGALLNAVGHLEGVSPAFRFVTRTVTDACLKQRWEEALSFRDGGYCLGSACCACGACASGAEQASITRHPRFQKIGKAACEELAAVEAAKRQARPLFCRVRLSDAYAGHSREYVNAGLLRDLIARAPQLVDQVLAAEEALFTAGQNEGRFPVPGGEGVAAIRAWDVRTVEKALAVLAEEESKGVKSAGGDATRFLGPLVRVTPGSFERAEFILHTALPAREAGQSASQWLNRLHLAHTLRRAGEGWQLDLAQNALKKKTVFACSVQPIEGGSCLTLACSPKFTLQEWLPTLPCHLTRPILLCQSVAIAP